MTQSGASLLYVWSLEKFLQRLPLMRECHEEGAENEDFDGVLDRLNQEPHKDPWREIALEEMNMENKGMELKA